MITLELLPAGSPDGRAAAALASHLNGPGAVGTLMRGFSRREGDEAVEGTVSSAADAVGILLAAVRSGRWLVVLTLGGQGAAPSTTTMRRARRSSGRCAVEAAEACGRTGDVRAVEAVLQLVAVLERRRSAPQQQAGRLTEAGASQREAAEALGVSQQAVHSRLRHGLWQETRTAVDAVLPLLQDLADSGSTGE